MDFEPEGFVVFRSSLLPFSELLEWDREKLRAAVARPEVREAIFLASPSLDESLEHWERDPDSERGKKVEHALVKYFARMTTRATPFGLFAGITLGSFAEKTELRLEPRARYRRVTRLDGEYLASLAQLLASEHRSSLRFEPNTSLYEAAGRLRFAAWRKTDAGRSYDLLAIEPTPHLRAALERARGGARLDEIGAAVAEAASVSPDEGTDFATRLAERQVLVPLLAPLVTGLDPLEGILGPLREVAPERAKPIEQVRSELRALDAGGLGAAPARYRELARSVEALGAPFELPRLFQVDLVKPGVARLGPRVREAFLEAVALAYRLGEPAPDPDLERWKSAFAERFEGQAVPLVLALDEESGIGFGGASSSEPLLRGLALPAPRARESREVLLQEKLARHRDHVLRLNDDDLRALEVPGPKPPLPDAFCAVGVLAGHSIDEGDFELHLASVFGPSGATLLGRFGHTDPSLLEKIREHLRREESARPDALFAEVVHLPEGRLGNVIFRPVLRAHEIPFLGRSGGGEAIAIQDLLVSLENSRVVLRTRDGHEVIPRITCAFNMAHRASQPLHRFLGALQHQGVASSLAWSWGSLEEAPFLPRVVHKKTVLALARWNVSQRSFEPVKKAKGSEAAFFAWRAALGLPRRFALADQDNILPVDLENALSREAFFQLVKERPRFLLTEIFPDSPVLEGPEGPFHHEVVVPFVTKKAPVSSRETRPPVNGARSFPPGSEWLFVKLYTGVGTADHVLRALVQPLVEETRGKWDRWFFLRYQDPGPHLRVRFHGSAWAEILARLEERARPLLSDGRIAKIQLDTYERELERYGDDEGVSLAEELFQADSECALSVIAATPGDAGADARWRLLVRGIDQLLSDLGLTVEEKRALARREREGYGSELGADDPFWRQLGARFRRERASLEKLLDRTQDAGPAIAAFERRSEKVRGLLPAIEKLSIPKTQLAGSYVHMHANRLLKTAQRAQEACLHYFLDRLYEAEIARKR